MTDLKRYGAMLACDVAGKRLMAVMGKRPTWETIDKLPKVRTRPVVIASGCNAMPWQAHDQFPPSWATHFIFAPEGE